MEPLLLILSHPRGRARSRQVKSAVDWNVLLLSQWCPISPIQPSLSTQLPFPPANINGSGAPGRVWRCDLREMINKSVSLWSPVSAHSQYSHAIHPTLSHTMEPQFTLSLCVLVLTLGQVRSYKDVSSLEQLTVRIEDHVTSRNCNKTLTDLEVSYLYYFIFSNCHLSW